MTDTVTFFKLSDNKVRTLIRDIVNEDGFGLSNHARERMKERSILSRHVKECLVYGDIIDEVFINSHNNWQLNLIRIIAGMRIKVTVAVDIESRVVVITAMKKDW